MAGAGKRFADVGYTDPKPFIPVLGSGRMIDLVLDNSRSPYIKTVILITQEQFLQKQEYLGAIEKIQANLALDGRTCHLVTVNGLTEGPACTVLAAQSLIDNRDPLYIINSDQLLMDPCNPFHRSIDFFVRRNADGGIPCFINDHPKWSYVGLKNGLVSEVVEKRVISPLATVGMYYYRRGSDFVSAASSMIASNFRVNNEFYVGPSYNYLITQGAKVVPFLINEMQGLGTPEDFQEYLKLASWWH